MPLLMLWGHGSFRTSYGYFKVPSNVQIQFFIDDNQTIDDGAMRFFEYGDLSNGVTDGLITKAQKVQSELNRISKNTDDTVKNYKLESVIGDIFASSAENALKNPNVWTPGKEGNDGDAKTHLGSIVREQARRGSTADPLIIQWCACTSNYIGEDEAHAPVARGKKVSVKDPTSSCCYISTATCSYLALPDDCEQLNKLRRFRDHVLLGSPRGAIDIKSYYASAPTIVRAIERQSDPEAIYRDIYSARLIPALAAIDRRDYASAYRIYKRMVAVLRRRFLRR